MSQNDGETEGRGCRVVKIANTLPGYRRHIVLLAFAGKADINGKPALIEVVIENLKRLAPLDEETRISHCHWKRYPMKPTIATS